MSLISGSAVIELLFLVITQNVYKLQINQGSDLNKSVSFCLIANLIYLITSLPYRYLPPLHSTGMTSTTYNFFLVKRIRKLWRFFPMFRNFDFSVLNQDSYEHCDIWNANIDSWCNIDLSIRFYFLFRYQEKISRKLIWWFLTIVGGYSVLACVMVIWINQKYIIFFVFG